MKKFPSLKPWLISCALLALLKLVGLISWPWPWVLSPLWGPVALVAAVILALAVAAMLYLLECLFWCLVACLLAKRKGWGE